MSLFYPSNSCNTLNQIVLSGGSTCFPGFGDRLLNEIRKAAPRNVKVRDIFDLNPILSFFPSLDFYFPLFCDHSFFPPNGMDLSLKIRIAAPPERKLSTWIGV